MKKGTFQQTCKVSCTNSKYRSIEHRKLLVMSIPKYMHKEENRCLESRRDNKVHEHMSCVVMVQMAILIPDSLWKYIMRYPSSKLTGKPQIQAECKTAVAVRLAHGGLNPPSLSKHEQRRMTAREGPGGGRLGHARVISKPSALTTSATPCRRVLGLLVGCCLERVLTSTEEGYQTPKLSRR